MKLTQERVIELITKGANASMRLARERARKINMHITGKNVVDFLETLDEYENTSQKALREKLVKSNRSLFSFLLRPVDKIFVAKGGAINYNLTQENIEKLKKGISDIADGIDIKKYLKKVVKKQYFIDPNGILFIDIDSEGKLETYVIDTTQIMWYDLKGNKVNAIIFEPYKKEDDEKVELRDETGNFIGTTDKLYYRVIDSELDRVFVKEGNTVYEDTAQTLDNFFREVPAICLGDDKDPNEDIFESTISDVMDDADEILRDFSVKTVHKLAHAYPRYWSYEQACVRCGGEGEIQTLVTPATEVDPAVYEATTCRSCGGTGQKQRANPSDETILRVPQEGEVVIAPNVAGYVSPDIEMMKLYEESVERQKNNMFMSLWGTTFEQGGKKETATGRFLDSQPVQDRLRDISDTFAKFHKFMLDFYGKVIFRNPRYESSVTYGMRYIIESPDEILDKYIDVSREKVSEVAIKDLQDRYFEAEYQNDNIELLKRKKLSKLEPFPNTRVSEIIGQEFIDPKDKLRKLYFITWVNTLNDSQMILLTTEELRAMFEEYINTKSINNEPNTETVLR